MYIVIISFFVRAPIIICDSLPILAWHVIYMIYLGPLTVPNSKKYVMK